MNTVDLLRAIEDLGVAITDEPTHYGNKILITVPQGPGEPVLPFSFDVKFDGINIALRLALQVGRVAAANAREDMRK